MNRVPAVDLRIFIPLCLADAHPCVCVCVGIGCGRDSWALMPLQEVGALPAIHFLSSCIRFKRGFESEPTLHSGINYAVLLLAAGHQFDSSFELRKVGEATTEMHSRPKPKCSFLRPGRKNGSMSRVDKGQRSPGCLSSGGM